MYATVKTSTETINSPAIKLYHLPVENSLSQVTHGSALTVVVVVGEGLILYLS